MEQKQIKAAIVNIGDELLIGQIINTNASDIAQSLNVLGYQIIEICTIADDEKSIIDKFSHYLAFCDVVFTTGGLGTTNDDKTKSCICKLFHRELVENKAILENLQQIQKDRSVVLPDSVFSQALIPNGVTIIDNPIGTAAGMWVADQGKILIATPGVPEELRSMLPEITEKLRQQFHGFHKIDKCVKVFNISESLLSDLLQDFEQQLPKHISLAYLPKMGIITLRLSAFGKNQEILENEMNVELNKLYDSVGEFIFCHQDRDLPDLIAEALIAQKASMATAESCTGGYIAHQITSLPGSSQYFKGSVVAYCNEIKKQVLQVNSKIIEQYGAVSRQTVVAMAENLLQLYKVDYALSISGIAGPDGGSPENPVGTVWIAVAKKNKVLAQCYHLGNGRQRIIGRGTQTALFMLYKLIRNL